MDIESFNPHTHAGCDAVNNFFELKSKVSIHTPTQGVTTISCVDLRNKYSFNPHTHAGCDCPFAGNANIQSVSIHTPTQGVTVLYSFGRQHSLSFNPHTHAGCDEGNKVITTVLRSFNPHTHAGCDHLPTITLTK